MIIELNISYAIKRLMESLSYSTYEFASYLGVEPRHISNYIYKHNKPSRDVFDKIIALIDENNIDIYSLFDVLGNDGYLFHGSKTGGIVGTISTRRNINESNDFGNGFYLSESLKTAVSYVITYNHPVIYQFKKKDIVDDNIYSFYADKKNGSEDWVLYIGLNRGKIKEDVDRYFFQQYYDEKFNRCSLLMGEIADSYNFDVMDYFFDNMTDITKVKQALSFANIGPQYVLKNEDIANKLVWVNEYHIDTMLKEYLIKLLKKKKDNLKNSCLKDIYYKDYDKTKMFDAIKNKKKKEYGQLRKR